MFVENGTKFCAFSFLFVLFNGIEKATKRTKNATNAILLLYNKCTMYECTFMSLCLLQLQWFVYGLYTILNQ